MKKSSIRLIVVAYLISLLLGISGVAAEHPNILLVLADDLGYGDLHCFGNQEMQTPKTQPGSTSNEPVCGVDFLPTVCEITGIAIPTDRKIDGASILPVIDGGAVRRSTPLYWHFNHATGGPQVALRNGDWKIVATLDRPPQRRTAITPQSEADFKSAELREFELYNLRDDVGEKHDLAETQPAKLSELRGLLRAKYREVRDESPIWPEWKPPEPPRKKK